MNIFSTKQIFFSGLALICLLEGSLQAMEKDCPSADDVFKHYVKNLPDEFNPEEAKKADMPKSFEVNSVVWNLTQVIPAKNATTEFDTQSPVRPVLGAEYCSFKVSYRRRDNGENQFPLSLTFYRKG